MTLADQIQNEMKKNTGSLKQITILERFEASKPFMVIFDCNGKKYNAFYSKNAKGDEKLQNKSIRNE